MTNNLIDEWPQTKLLYAQDMLEDCSGDYGAGFNMRINGYTDQEANGYPAYRSRSRWSGWAKADKLIDDGKIFYKHIFNHLAWGQVCNRQFSGAFPYGGTYVCNGCGRSHVDEPWWNVKVYRDGNAWCCIGLGFLDLQTSDNYAFGDTREQALANYEKLMLEKAQ